MAENFDAVAPMVYWLNRQPTPDTIEAMTILKALGKPILPVGQAYDGGPEGGRPGVPPPAELNAVHAGQRRAGRVGRVVLVVAGRRPARVGHHPEHAVVHAARVGHGVHGQPDPRRTRRCSAASASPCRTPACGTSATVAATSAYQRAARLPVTGGVDATTRSFLLRPFAPPIRPSDLFLGLWAWRARGRCSWPTAAATSCGPSGPTTSTRWRTASPACRRSTRLSRFFNATKALSEEQLRYFTEIDYVDHFAWVVFSLDDPAHPGVGVARYVRLKDDPEAAEAAFTVIDDHQGRGLGILLVVALADVARKHDIHRFVLYIRTDNEPMIALAPCARCALRGRRTGGVPGRAATRRVRPRRDGDVPTSRRRSARRGRSAGRVTATT